MEILSGKSVQVPEIQVTDQLVVPAQTPFDYALALRQVSWL